VRPKAVIGAAFIWLACLSAFGQRQPLASVVAPESIPEHSVARIVCDTTADDVRFEVFELLQLKDSRGRTVEVIGPPVEFLDFSSGDSRQFAFTGPPGRYLLRFDAVDYDERKREFSTSVIEVVAGKPRPVPPDDDEDDPPDDDDDKPDVPDDRFGNLGANVVKWLSQIPAADRVVAKDVAKVYSDVADGLEPDSKGQVKYVTIDKSNAAMTVGLNSAIGARADSWKAWRASVGVQLNGRIETRQDVIDAYRVVANALGGKP